MNLAQAIAQQINLGQKDPAEIAKRILSDNDQDWLGSELLALAEDVIEELARHQLGTERRKAIALLKPRDQRGQGDAMLKSVWVPSEHGFTEYKRVADMTAPDWRARADWLDRLVLGIMKQAIWCREVARLIEDAGFEKTGELGELPPLPEDNELELPESAAE